MKGVQPQLLPIDPLHLAQLLQLLLQLVDFGHVPGVYHDHLHLLVGGKQGGSGDDNILAVAGLVAQRNRAALLDGQKRHRLLHPDGIDELPDVAAQQFLLCNTGVAHIGLVHQQNLAGSVSYQNAVKGALQDLLEILNILLRHGLHACPSPSAKPEMHNRIIRHY
ncbi:hypothetical protein SDC9_121098 [bioreactor metagenome]|uniref:Uncharacterized protein n=1 Tax=bioreactor metagenome TaxID=1076179 RepID=A0A645CB00_9ZZZZ